MISKFHWTKLGLTFPVKDQLRPPWMHSHAQAPASLAVGDRLRIYFSTRPPRDSGGQYLSFCGYVDVDPADPTRVIETSSDPVLPLGEVGSFDEFGIYPWSAIWDNGIVRAYYGGWTRTMSVPFNVGIGVAESTDGGTTFERVGRGGPVLSYSPDEPFILSSPRIRKFGDTFYLFYIAGKRWIRNGSRLDPIYRIRAAHSTDGLKWEKFHRDLIPAKLFGEAQASPDVFFLNGEYHMFFSYRNARDFHFPGRGYRLGHARSKDLVTWVREDEATGLQPTPGGFDSETIGYPHFFETGGNYFLAYLGNDFGLEGFGLAKLEGIK